MSSALKSPIHHDSLADVLERVLDKGVVIAGDVIISLVGIELLSIKVRLLITTVDKAIEMGINWWEMDPSLSASAREAERALEAQNANTAPLPPPSAEGGMELARLEDERRALEETNRELRGRLAILERRMASLEN